MVCDCRKIKEPGGRLPENAKGEADVTSTYFKGTRF